MMACIIHCKYKKLRSAACVFKVKKEETAKKACEEVTKSGHKKPISFRRICKNRLATVQNLNYHRGLVLKCKCCCLKMRV